MEINGRIKELRLTLQLTQQEFGRPLHLNQNSLSSIENGKRNASRRLLDDLVRNYHVRMEWLLTGKEPMLQDFMEHMNIDEEVKEVVRQYLLLIPQQRKIIRDMIDALIGERIK